MIAIPRSKPKNMTLQLLFFKIRGRKNIKWKKLIVVKHTV
jgi:hypothetical protein